MKSFLLEHLNQIVSLLSVFTIALISPGPDFALIVKNSLVYSRKTALLTALGIALSVLLYVTFILMGLGLVISSTPELFLGIKYLGAAYLLYLGYKGLRASKSNLNIQNLTHKNDISEIKAIWTGFLTNALNPKCILFLVSLFLSVITPDTPKLILFIYGALTFAITIIWFSFIGCCLSAKSTREKFSKISHWIERITGGFLIAMAIKILMMQ